MSKAGGVCHKLIYPSKADAKKDIKRINRVGKSQTGFKKLKNAYYCEKCSGWHTTSLSKESSRDLTEKMKAWKK